MSCSSSLSFIASIDLHVSVSDDLAPLLDLALLEVRESRAGKTGARGDTERLHLFAEGVATGDARALSDQHGGQAVRQFCRREHTPPGRGLEIGIAGFGNGWHVG